MRLVGSRSKPVLVSFISSAAVDLVTLPSAGEVAAVVEGACIGSSPPPAGATCVDSWGVTEVWGDVHHFEICLLAGSCRHGQRPSGLAVSRNLPVPASCKTPRSDYRSWLNLRRRHPDHRPTLQVGLRYAGQMVATRSRRHHPAHLRPTRPLDQNGSPPAVGGPPRQGLRSHHQPQKPARHRYLSTPEAKTAPIIWHQTGGTTSGTRQVSSTSVSARAQGEHHHNSTGSCHPEAVAGSRSAIDAAVASAETCPRLIGDE
jgi:hypothetical protein